MEELILNQYFIYQAPNHETVIVYTKKWFDVSYVTLIVVESKNYVKAEGRIVERYYINYIHEHCTRVTDEQEIKRLDKKRLLLGI